MAKKRKRKRPTGYRGEGGSSTSGSRAEPSGATSPSPSRRSSERSRAVPRQGASSEAGRPSMWGGLLGRRGSAARRPSLQPPVASTLARGVAVVGSSPLLLVITFLAVLGLWLGFSGYGVVTSPAPRALVLLIALPPIHTLLDLEFLAGGRIVGPGQVVAFSVGLVLVRAALTSLLASLIHDALRSPSGRQDVRGSLRRAARSFVPMTGIELGFLTLATIALYLVTGFLGPLGVIVALVAGLYFFSFAQVIAVAEGVGAVRAAQLSIKAARVPGPQHMLLVTAYLAGTLFVAVVAPVSRVAAATPSVAVWAFALIVGFLHVSVLAAFMYRWFLIREHALAPAEGTRTRQRAPARG
jgi:hypothetical protein